MAQQVDLDVPNGPGAATRSTASDTRPAPNLDQVAEIGGQIAAAISQIVLGKPEVVRLASSRCWPRVTC